jgi:hypothetical protein
MDYNSEFRCSICDSPFTPETWEDRHTACNGEDCHAECCDSWHCLKENKMSETSADKFNRLDNLQKLLVLVEVAQERMGDNAKYSRVDGETLATIASALDILEQDMNDTKRIKLAWFCSDAEAGSGCIWCGG